MAKKKDRKLGIALMRFRRGLRLHQHEIGAAAGVSARTVLRWENGQAVPNAKRLVILARGLHDIDPDGAERVVAAAGTSLAALGVLAVPPLALSDVVPASARPTKERVELAAYAAAEEMDVPMARVRAPLAKLLRRLGGLGIGLTWEEAAAAISLQPTSKRS